MRLRGKRTIITGAGQGIGAAIAQAYVSQGASVCVAEIDVRQGELIAAQLRAAGGDAFFVKCDVSKKEDVGITIAAARERFGRIDVLVNNAGVNVFRDPLKMTEEDWRRCLAIDLDGAMYASCAVLPAMLEQNGGAIINIASTHSFSIIPGCFPYPVAKHALLGLTRSLGIEYAARGIRVNAIAPGYVDTPIADAYFKTFPDPAIERRKAENLHPPKRMARPDEVAMTAVFLGSDEAPFINASVITIDGGRSVVYHD
ncbi:SDR family oxidoreductase [Asticcacaulis sp.]|uniref:SDR family oxidoreductase n=1 Tax=Asticcacaulis sp. TaxID=1872648 RepID=UPI002CA55732|nr:SDR family oxidoreductase [Asticcacaulis sp.]HTM81552.1 SDR family oxidoreductase [Asticcacaulis sp.]